MKSTVHDVFFDKGVLKIAMPSLKGHLVPLPRGDFIYVTALSDKVVYGFSSRVLDYGRDDDGFLVMYVTISSYVKGYKGGDLLEYHFFLNGTYSLPGEDKQFRFVTRDFSAGGMLMCTNNVLAVGQPIFVNLELEGIKLQQQKAQIVRSAGKNEATGLYEYGVQFLEVPPELERALVVFVFQQELKMKEKVFGEEA